MTAREAWLGVTAVHSVRGPGSAGPAFRRKGHSRTMAKFVTEMQALCDFYPQLRLHVNFFDAVQPQPNDMRAIVRDDARINTSWMTGMRTIVWKRLLTRERVSGLQAVWLLSLIHI